MAPTNNFIQMNNIVIIGSGNVATHLGQALFEIGKNILQVWSRNIENAQILATKLCTKAISNFEDIDTNADMYIISVKDDAIKQVLQSPQLKDKTIIHTAGSVAMSTIAPYSQKYGVFYPLQTFSKEKEISFDNIPILIEANNKELEEELVELAKNISHKVSVVSSEQRKYLHIAAVFACNFTNYFYGIAQELLEQNNLDFELIRPLILETAQKIQKSNPQTVQTGPAIRKDTKVINSHIELLDNNSEIQKLYKDLSQRIMNRE